MPWLAPIGTPMDNGPIESQVPIWQSIRASRSLGSAFTRGSACVSIESPFKRLGIGVRMRLARAQALDAMVDGADAGRKPQPFGRVQGHGGIEDHGARHHQIMAQHFLDLGALVGDAGQRAELAAGDGRRDADLAHRRCRHRRHHAPACPDPVDVIDGATSLARQICTALAPSVIEPPPTVTIRSALAARACSAAAMTASRGVCGGIASKVAAQRAPRLLRIFSISSVSRLRVPLTIRNARLARRRSICSTTASAAGRPKTTSSMAPKTTRP